MDFRASFLVNELDKKRKFIADNIGKKSDSIKAIVQKDLSIIQSVLRKDFFKKGLEKELSSPWRLERFTPDFNTLLEEFFAAYKKFYLDAYNRAAAAKEAVILNHGKAARLQPQ